MNEVVSVIDYIYNRAGDDDLIIVAKTYLPVDILPQVADDVVDFLISEVDSGEAVYIGFKDEGFKEVQEFQPDVLYFGDKCIVALMSDRAE